VLAYGPLQAVDFHALPFGGEPLFAHHLVIYSLDLPVRSSPPSPGRPVALLVSNPQSDQGYLPAAGKEADEVAASIHNRGGWSLTRLDGPAARASAVSDALPEPTSSTSPVMATSPASRAGTARCRWRTARV